ncbi:MAG TPA: FKBP-type peptidyl-prolyl cis-trans isomerase [Verrucomicrobiota bacterium]|nr:FKBP-type peptidyl-prolyl cis-trans isomerase [Verrucomicrobiota bacterium]
MNTKAKALATLAFFTAGSLLSAEESSAFTNEQDKISYAIGLNIGSNWKRQDVEVNYEYLVRGLKDAVSDEPNLLTDDQIRDTLGQYQQQLMAKQQEKRRQAAEKNKAEGEAYLVANKSKPGVVTTESGLQYKIIKEGEGDSPKPNDTVYVNYRGTLVDGTEFDSNAGAGRPASFHAGGVIRGWSEALSMMKPGAKWELAIPAELAYGDAGSLPASVPAQRCFSRWNWFPSNPRPNALH